ncbi:hypothetical protein [Escherichia coli]|uniref:hypothetical protein n=1 Tax=Escherichia coli TaxID=562 RepID=UPI00191A98EF|nr:hypothetical protein [Escherichia coli]CAD5569048.1 Uncharacterised protein [Escherichia coli]
MLTKNIYFCFAFLLIPSIAFSTTSPTDQKFQFALSSDGYYIASLKASGDSYKHTYSTGAHRVKIILRMELPLSPKDMLYLKDNCTVPGKWTWNGAQVEQAFTLSHAYSQYLDSSMYYGTSNFVTSTVTDNAVEFVSQYDAPIGAIRTSTLTKSGNVSGQRVVSVDFKCQGGYATATSLPANGEIKVTLKITPIINNSSYPELNIGIPSSNWFTVNKGTKNDMLNAAGNNYAAQYQVYNVKLSNLTDKEPLIKRVNGDCYPYSTYRFMAKENEAENNLKLVDHQGKTVNWNNDFNVTCTNNDSDTIYITPTQRGSKNYNIVTTVSIY